ncbi:Uncharacterised protein [Kingella negevensis]|uniref:Uncharacterized protein n=1 Tax=Kingella negevensis TaxID=1522312 RepID=A0A238TG83_9NEIS|nr:Uncharacterised protein [Kingella negevensis]
MKKDIVNENTPFRQPENNDLSHSCKVRPAHHSF